MVAKTALFCVQFPEKADAITQWATCNFTVLVFTVFVTIMVLFIIALLSLAHTFRKV